MLKWIEQFRAATPQTKYFILTWAVFGITLVFTTVYCFARMDYVRSYKTKVNKQEINETVKK